MKSSNYYFQASLWVLFVAVPLFFLVSLPERQVGVYRESIPRLHAFIGESKALIESLEIFDHGEIFLANDPVLPQNLAHLNSEVNSLDTPVELPRDWVLALDDQSLVNKLEKPGFLSLLDSEKVSDTIMHLYAEPLEQPESNSNTSQASITKIFPENTQTYNAEGFDGSVTLGRKPVICLMLQENALILGPPLVLNRLPNDLSQELLNDKIVESLKDTTKDDGYFFAEIH